MYFRVQAFFLGAESGLWKIFHRFAHLHILRNDTYLCWCLRIKFADRVDEVYAPINEASTFKSSTSLALPFSASNISMELQAHGYRPCEEHIAGLRIKLLPHQRSVVQWLTDQEGIARGLNGYFWAQHQ